MTSKIKKKYTQGTKNWNVDLFDLACTFDSKEKMMDLYKFVV